MQTVDYDKNEPRLIALSRADGQMLWRISLPSIAVYDGRLVAADGTCRVAFCDGTVAAYGRVKQ